MIRLLVADDHPVVRRGLVDVLSHATDMTVAAEADTGPAVLSKIRSGRYDVVLLDLSMPGMSGLEVLKQLRIEMPRLPVLMLSVHPEEQYAIRALKAGASGYLTKSSAPEELVNAIKTVAKGRRYITPSLAEKLADEVADIDNAKPVHETLSDREFEVFCMIGRGLTVTEIATQISLSPKTVSTYRSRILSKMGMTSGAQLIHYALKQGLID